MMYNLGREPQFYDMKPQQHKAELKFSCTLAGNQTQVAPDYALTNEPKSPIWFKLKAMWNLLCPKQYSAQFDTLVVILNQFFFIS